MISRLLFLFKQLKVVRTTDIAKSTTFAMLIEFCSAPVLFKDHIMHRKLQLEDNEYSLDTPNHSAP
jgi:hypothetical protein